MQILNQSNSDFISPGSKASDLIRTFKKGYIPLKRNGEINEAIMLGKCQIRPVTLSHRNAINRRCAESNIQESNVGFYFKKFSYHCHVFLTRHFNANNKSLDSLVLLKDGCIASIIEIVTCKRKLFILCEVLRVQQLQFCDAEYGSLLIYIKKYADTPGSLKAVYPTDIQEKCLSLAKDEITYIIPIPNSCEST